jgi:hypothetical protein
MNGALAWAAVGYGCGLTAAIIFVVALCQAARRGDNIAEQAIADRHVTETLEQVGDDAGAVIFDFVTTGVMTPRLALVRTSDEPGEGAA